MSVEALIRDKLIAAFAPTQLSVENQSHLHAGHAGSPGTGHSHFSVDIVAPGFTGTTRVQRQRMIMAALKEELAGPVHALQIKADAP